MAQLCGRRPWVADSGGMADGGSFLPRLAPLLLRVVIGGTFLWAGLGKLIPEVEFRGQDAAIAANLGAPVKLPAKPAAPSKLALPPPSQIPLGDQPASPPAPVEAPTAPTSPPQTAPGGTQGAGESVVPLRPVGPARPAADTDLLDVRGLPVAAGVARGEKRQAQAGAGSAEPAATPPLAALPPGGKFTAGDFPTAVKLPRVYQLAVVLTKAAHPVQGKSVWPKQVSGNPWAVYAAYLVAVVEVLAGGAVLLGFFVKPASLVLAGVILSAIWITQIGPAAMGVAPSVLGFIPSRTWYDPQQWTPLLWQMLIFVTCLALAMIGPGHLSADAALSAIGASEKGHEKGEK